VIRIRVTYPLIVTRDADAKMRGQTVGDFRRLVQSWSRADAKALAKRMAAKSKATAGNPRLRRAGTLSHGRLLFTASVEIVVRPVGAN